MANIINFDDSLDDSLESPNRHPLQATSEQLDFNGYGRILTDEGDQIDPERVKNSF